MPLPPIPTALPQETRLYARWENLPPQALTRASPRPRFLPHVAMLALRLFGRAGR